MDQRFSDHLFAGVEISRRDRDVLETFLGSVNPPYAQDRETFYRAYASWAPLSELAINLTYQLDVFDHHARNFPDDPDTRTHSVPLVVNYDHPSGWLGRMSTTYVNQTVRHFLQPDQPLPELHDDFFLLNAGLGYRQFTVSF